MFSPVSHIHTHRLSTLQSHLAKCDQTHWLLSRPSDIFYYTGFGFLLAEEREAFLIVTPDEATLWYASFSPLPAVLPCPAQPMQGIASLAAWLHHQHFTSLAIDSNNLSVEEFRQLFPKVTTQQADMAVPQYGDINRQLIWSQRLIKDETELRLIAAASDITKRTFEQVQPLIKTGMSELDVAHLIDQAVRAADAQSAFPTIVAFGSNSALPHHQPTTKKLDPETAILLDFGAKFESYCSDFTRTWWHGTRPSQQFLTVESVVHSAYQAGLQLLEKSSAAETPLTAAAVDQAVRSTIAQSGFGEAFIHTTGHGLGIEIHEPPSISSRNFQILQPNMIITIEPGVYLGGEFGYRFENTVQITSAAPIITTDSTITPPKHL